MVRYDRVDFLQAVNKRQLFAVTQRDESSGDNLIHYAVLAGKADFIDCIKGMFENEINTKNDQGNTPLHFACLTGNLEIVKILLAFQNGFSTVPGVSGSSQPGAGQGIEMCAVNKDGLLPIHLAIARSRYFVVHHLLRQEQVLLHLVSAPFDLYMCLKLAITYRSIQLLRLLYQVF